MLDEAEYASDTDESDEDYNPEGAASDVASEAESEGEAENDADNDAESKRRVNKRSAANATSVETKRSKRSEETVTKSIEKDTLDDDDDDVDEDALWAKFMSNTGQAEIRNDTKIEKCAPSKTVTSTSNGSTSKVEPNKSTDETTTEKPQQKKVVTEIFDFAGETVEIQKEVTVTDNSMAQPKKATTKSAAISPFNRPQSGGGGLSSVLGQIGKKNKLSVLEKSKLDWTGFKKNEGIDEELQTFNKGRDGYLERQDFLQRTDLRQFEIEKNIRSASRRK